MTFDPYDYHGCSGATSQYTSAAIVRSRQLVVATLEATNGGLRLVEERSFACALSGPSQDAVSALACHLERTIQRCRIRDLTLPLASPKARQYVPSAFAFKIETVLQLTPALRLHAVRPQRITAWLKRVDPILPTEPITKFFEAFDANLLRASIEAAAFVVEHGQMDDSSDALED